MGDYRVKTPVAIVNFNRPDHTQRVLEEIRKVRPYKVYVIQDGPREGNNEDVHKCKEVREVLEGIDWDCQVFENISDVNMGCCKRPYTGISWVFEQEETAIVLEDDCVPSPDFFKFCDYILERYQDDERVMLISGTNIKGKWRRGEYSYHFSSLGGIHGWASWRRAWKYIDIEIQAWDDPAVKDLMKQNTSKRLFEVREPIYDNLVNRSSQCSTWAMQWGFARLIQSGVAIVPCENMITNIGYGSESTHTSSAKTKSANLALGHLNFPINDPPFIMVDREYDREFVKILYSSKYRVWLSQLKKKILRR